MQATCWSKGAGLAKIKTVKTLAKAVGDSPNASSSRLDLVRPLT
jgi:hypothetical protein